MPSITPDQRARMLDKATAQFKARGMSTSQAKRAAAESLRRFMEDQIEQEKKERQTPAS